MKYLLFIALFAVTAIAQNGPVAVRATTRVLADGSRATTITDSDAKTATESVADAAGKPLRKTLFTLDDAGNSTGAIHYDAKGNVRYKESYKRDGAGKISTSYLFSKDDKLLGHRTYIYDAKGGVQQIDDFDAAGKLIPKATPKPGSGKRR